MGSKIQAMFTAGEEPIVLSGARCETDGEEGAQTLWAALNANIRESLDEIDILRGTVQYWEGRRAATDPRERDMLVEAFRVMHGELLGLTARMKELLSRAEVAP